MVSQSGFSFLGTGQAVWVSDVVSKLSKSHRRQVVTLVASLLRGEDGAGSGFWLFVETLLLTRSRPVSVHKYGFPGTACPPPFPHLKARCL